MHDQTDHDRVIEPIDEMPAAPEADQGTRDADAPTWSAPTEGHGTMPLTPPPTADAASAATAPTADAASAATADAASARSGPPDLISADRVEVHQGGAQRIEGREITINQGGAAVIRGDQIRIEQGGAFAIIGRRITMRDSGAFILLARRADGDVTVAFDWRALAAFFIGLIALKVARGRR